MQKGKRWLYHTLAAALIIGIAYILFYFVFLDLVVNYWWFKTNAYSQYFFLRLFYRYLIFAFVVLFFFLIFFLNFWIASRYIGAARPPHSKNGSKRRAYHDVIEMFRVGSMKVYTPLSLVLAIFIAIPIFKRWETFLFYIFGPSTGAVDPVYGKDIGYYLFSYPIYTLLQQRLMFAFLFLLVASIILYWIERRMLYKTDREFPMGAKIHLNFLALMTALLYGWAFWLQRYGLLYNKEHLPLFYGPGFTQMNVTLPLIWACLGFGLAAILSLLYWINTRKKPVPAIVCILLFIAALGLRHSDYLPEIVQKYVVLPNQLSEERPYITNSVDATLAAYNLNHVQTRIFRVEQLPWVETAKAIRLNIKNIPVWDPNLLDDVYDQLQAIRPYYNFNGVNVDRYTVHESYQQVNLSARELNLKKLPSYSKNWVNEHLQYTHGYGLVMTPAAQSGEEFMTWYIEGLRPHSQYQFKISQPGIYYGLEDYTYVIAPNKNGEMDYPTQDTFVTSDYQGKVGVPINSLFRRLLFAIYFKDKNILLTMKTTDKSRILFRRNFPKAIHILTPFFALDKEPYLVVTKKELYWIQDAYTRSSWYPNAATYDGKHNYIRNSLKIVVNAYDGTIRYYICDPSDPIIRAYDRMYPGLLHPLSQMPADIRAHIRYPKDVFKAQMKIYNKYHQKNPATFFQDEDLWQFAEQSPSEIKGTDRHPMHPYYLTLNLIQKDRQDFLLLAPISPKNRPNLRALVLAGCDGDHYGKIYVYSFPKGEQVYGPGQISALIDQDTTIAQQFNLWNQIGSEVKRGRIIILPIGQVVFYIQPVYLTSSARWKIPQLQRLIVSQGDVVSMEDSLEKAFAKVEAELKSRMEYQKESQKQVPPTGAEQPRETAPPPKPADKNAAPSPPGPGKTTAPSPPGPDKTTAPTNGTEKTPVKK
jgi:uncharacterized membrane protein (UPF0182 family)